MNYPPPVCDECQENLVSTENDDYDCVGDPPRFVRTNARICKDCTMNIDPFTAAYIEAALWSSTDDDQEHLDANYTVDDLAPETLAKMVADCARFQAENAADIHADDACKFAADYSPSERAGHDFWLNRNGHGCGFWDGDWTEPHAYRLSAASEAFGQYDLYVSSSDDGSTSQIYGA